MIVISHFKLVSSIECTQGDPPTHGTQMDPKTLESWIEVIKTSIKINVDVTNIIPFGK